MNIKEIVEGMTAPQVAQVIKDNFNEVDKDKANKTDLNKSISDLASVVEANKTDLTKKIDNNKEDTDAKLSELGSKANDLENSVNANRYGYNVTVNGLKGGIHTIETAIKDVPSKFRMLGQKITFRTENGDWATYHNESLSLDNYENVDDWVQEVGISSVTGDINISNNPDYEDLTEAKDGTIKFADKEYNKESFSGLGRVYLRKNIVDGVNVLTQEMMPKPNTIYIIQYDYDLQGEEIIIPEGCVLDFQGGSFSNGYIIFNNTYIDSNYVVFKGCKIEGKVCNINILSDWFDLDYKFENTLALRDNGKTLIFNPSETLNVAKKNTNITQSNFYIKNLHANLINVNPLFFIGTTQGKEPIKNILIENCCIESDSKDSRQIFLLGNSENVTIRNNKFKNVGYCIIQSKGHSSNRVVVESNTAENCTADFIECNCTASAISYDWIIRDNKYYGSINYPNWDDTHTENRFIGVTAVKNIIITNNFAEKSARDSMVHLEDVGGELVLTGNVLKNPIGYFIWFINNVFQKCIISNNIFEIDEDTCCGKGSYASSTAAPYFISSEGDEYRTEEILVSNNIFIGKNIKDNYCGIVNGNGLIIKNNIFDNIYGITGLRTKAIEGNYFKGCLNCFKLRFSGIEEGLRYINNIDVNTKDYSIYIESNDNQISYYNNPVITNNKISGKVRIGEVHGIVFNDNICDLFPDKININVPGSKASTVSQNNNNIFNFINTSINYPSKSIEEGVNNEFNGLGYYKNNIYKAYNNQWYNLNSAFVSDSNPAINNIGATVFRTDLGKPIICKSIGKRQIFKFSILGTPSDNGSITFSQEDISATVPTYIDDSIEDIINRIFAVGIPGTISYTHDNASISVLDITTLNREPPIIECSDSNLSCKFSKIDFATNSVYVEADGAIAGVLRVGTFSEKPLSNHIYVGFEYFCTDKQTTEGSIDGIMIYHKGNNVWVDALGRVVE